MRKTLTKQLSGEAAELNTAFSRAAQQTRLMVQQKVLTAAEVTELDGMFRQATIGDGSAWALLRDPKFMVDFGIKEKSEAWAAHRGMDPVSAKKLYLDMVERLIAKYNVVIPISRASSAASVATCYTYVPN